MCEWAAATSWDSTRESLLRRRPLPRLPRHRAAAAGDDGTGRQAAQHGALPMLRRGVPYTDDEHGWKCLDTGKLICTHET